METGERRSFTERRRTTQADTDRIRAEINRLRGFSDAIEWLTHHQKAGRSVAVARDTLTVILTTGAQDEKSIER